MSVLYTYYVKMCDYTFVHMFTVCVYVRITNCSLEWLNVVLLCLPLCTRITKCITFMYTRTVLYIFNALH